MSEPVTIRLTAHQQQRFKDYDAQELIIKQRRDDTAFGIIAGVVDPATLKGFAIQVTPDAIVCTPPKEEQST